ncbi:MAG TPA: rhomboid family intramembrane serine protease [bacterium]|nr:rhomboid family intramembrane serine protease [bacterium]
MFFFFPLRDEYRVKKFPVLVLTIIIINVAIFLLHVANPEYDKVLLKYGFIPSDFSVTTLFTSMFLHGGIMHLAFNMWYLWLFGNNIEDRWGRIPFILFYLSAGIFSMLLYSALIPEQAAGIPTIGASGAIAGVLGAYAILFPKSRITFKYFIWIFLFIIRFGEFRLYAVAWLAFWFVQQSFSTLLAARGITASSVAFGAHFAGFLYGAVIGLGTRLYREAKFRENVQLGKNVLFNLLGSKQHPIRNMEEYGKIEHAKSLILSEIDEDRLLASKYYGEITEKYPEVTLPEKIQYAIADSLYRQGERDKAYLAYKNFVLNYPLSKLADNALLAIGKILVEKKDYQKAKYAFLQVVLFYPYSDCYEESKYYLEKQLPRLSFENTL